jgi:hypothetical protein
MLKVLPTCVVNLRLSGGTRYADWATEPQAVIETRARTVSNA